MSILDRSTAGKDFRIPKIPQGTWAECRVTKPEEEFEWTKAAKGSTIVTTLELIEPVISDLTDLETGAPIMVDAGREYQYKQMLMLVDKEGNASGKYGDYADGVDRKLDKYGRVFEGDSFSGALNDASRVGLTCLAFFAQEESDLNGEVYNVITKIKSVD